MQLERELSAPVPWSALAVAWRRSAEAAAEMVRPSEVRVAGSAQRAAWARPAASLRPEEREEPAERRSAEAAGASAQAVPLLAVAAYAELRRGRGRRRADVGRAAAAEAAGSDVEAVPQRAAEAAGLDAEVAPQRAAEAAGSDAAAEPQRAAAAEWTGWRRGGGGAAGRAGGSGRRRALWRRLRLTVGAELFPGLRHDERCALRIRAADVASCVTVKAVVASSTRRRFIMMIRFPEKSWAAE